MKTSAKPTALYSLIATVLVLMKTSGLKSVAFYCISTGEFRFPNRLVAEIAVQTVCEFLAENPEMRVVFNVFKDVDLGIYQELLGE
ncbi:macro domain-containing protein [Aggregatibacter actinomycetemcomitans]|uniref:macro domain-containing protein n=1 Tax=Aggregatibacter actinomycetemcomitans TaxID=714 RepID=UPI00197C09BE|nr:macro domain-containing protein [Aggregatibacter actinomycetemcomitans]MBN6069785.1 macro domain-containing protein [Aggregatibacter actinomycetemcomitans]